MIKNFNFGGILAIDFESGKLIKLLWRWKIGGYF